ncbi:glycosyltransferase family 8 protein [Micromonospora polyrhachis]|uniref:Lipopolysaccharide biosynthesis glycosyltransferase n=1 Tax=Micromonospora polyrhachis TaxID=1282883 RepID=A0A7W7WSU9_9ACTN|nr:glycosyltransferase [Micromonospora polyrhachis]MBB4961788.1 lipopolysaccharide biosynthesis glycosyltransferase [Micromonospora polyrhachis]
MPDDPPVADGSSPGSTIRVATATDRRYLPYAAAMAQSLAAHRDPATPVELTILHADVSAAEQRRVECGAEGITVHWIRMDADGYQRWGIDPDPMLLAPQYFRCLLPRILPVTVQRVIYIDADTLVLDDLRPLWNWPLDGRPVAAVGDLVSVIRDAISHWQELGLDGGAPYFNSGVMVADLAIWRNEGIGERVLRRCQLDRDRLLIRDRWPQYDQYGFNVVLQNRWSRLPDRWNHFPERAATRPGIVHFLGDTKPGAPRTRPEFTRLFMRAVDLTPWAGWRPTPKPPALSVP